MTGLAELFEQQAMWDYDEDDELRAFPASPDGSDAPEGTETPIEFAVPGETTGDATPTLRALTAITAMEMLLAFNPHQRRGPDGRWIKMGTAERKGRRRDRDRARRAEQKAEKERAARVESDAPAQAVNTFRRNRDQFNRQVAAEAVNVQNDNEFEGQPDELLDNKLRHLQQAIDDNDLLFVDEWADDLHKHLVDNYPGADVPAVPKPPSRPAGSVELDEAALQQRLLDMLDDYNAEIYVTGKEWVDMLRDPDVRNDPESGLDHLPDSFIDLFEARVNALKRAILGQEPDKAGEDAAEIRRMLVGHQLQAEHDFPERPTIEDLRTQARNEANARRGQPAFKRKTSGLLTSGAPQPQRLAALERAAAGGVWGDEPIGQGAMGETKKVYFNDGTPAIYKKAKGDWNMGGDPWTPKDQTDAEEMASLVGAALGLRAPAVQRLSDDEIHMELVENAAPGSNRFYDKDAVDLVRVPGDVMGSDDGLLMGLFDTLIDNPDRHGFNWMIDDDSRIYPIDHGLAFINTRGTPRAFSAASRSPFAREYFITGGGSYKENTLSRRDIEYVRQQLAAVEPEFERAGRPGWYRVMQMRLDAIEARARGGASHQLPAPRQE